MGQKEIMQPLGQKNSRHLSGKIITQPLSTKKNQTTSWDKKIMQPSRDKKKFRQPLGTQKNHATFHDKKSRNLWDKKNHSTSQDKKSILQIAPNGINLAKWVQIG